MNIKSVSYFSQFMLRNLFRGNVTIKKLWALGMNLSYAFLRKPKPKYGPSAIWVEPVNCCNLQCKGCWVPYKQGKVEMHKLSLEAFKRNIDSLKDSLIMLILQMSGEPFLHPDIFQMIEYASVQKIATWTSSNCSYLTSDDWGDRIVKSGLDTLYVSVSGVDQEVYDKYHQFGSIQKVVQNIKKINESKERLGSSTPHIFFRFLVTDDNKQDLVALRKLAKELGLGVHPRVINSLYTYEGSPPANPSHEDVCIHGQHRPEVGNKCHGLWIAMALKASQVVYPCCYDWLFPPTVGSADSATLRDVWFSEEFNAFREQILTGRKDISSCQYCDNSLGFRDSFSKKNNEIIIKFKDRNGGHDA